MVVSNRLGLLSMSLPTFVTSESFSAGKQVTLGEEEAHHIRVRRLDVGAHVALLDGQGLRGTGTLVRIAKRNATVEVHEATQESPRRDIHLILPIADKDRMLWLAEKACELGVASWRPVQFRRSRSVAARGEGPMFTQKIAARMRSAMEQSGNAWLPAIYPDANVERAIAAVPVGKRFVLDGAGASLGAQQLNEAQAHSEDAIPEPISLVVGPEGGIEDDEMAKFVEAGFVKASVGKTILRFETAAIAALGAILSHG
jgi:16S rRNA (uracil1498-N3)-methyltransferase